MIFPKTSSTFIEQNIAFEQWHQQVQELAQQLSSCDEQHWLLFEQDSYQFSVTFFALIAARKSIVLPQNGQPQQLQDCMNNADIYIGSESLSGYRVFHSKKLPIQHSPQPVELYGECAIVFYTSGSSGSPKAINKTFEQLVTEIEQLERCFGLALADALIMATVSHQHIYGLIFKMLWPIWAGRDVYLTPFEYPEHLAHQIISQRRNVCLISSPAYYHRLIKDNMLIACHDHISALFSSGGPLEFGVAQALTQQLNCTPFEVFGSTETGGIAWRQRSECEDQPWLVFGDIEIDIDLRSQRLSIKSPYMSGDNWYQTDDRIEIVSNNQFKLLGRADRIVKIEEKRCSLDDIESKLNAHPFIDQAHVLLVRDVHGHKRDCLGAAIVLNEQGLIALTGATKFSFDRQLKDYLKAYFEALVIPRKFRHLEQLPFNAQGKLNKKQLEQLFE